MLCQRKCRNDPEDLEGVLPVLDRRLYDGGDGGVVLRARFRAEASADLEFGLGRPQGLLAVVVRGRDGGVREEGEDVVPVFGDAFLELVQFGAVPVLFRVDRRPRQQFVQPRLHILPRPLPDFPLVPTVHGVPQEVKHVQAPGVIREGLRVKFLRELRGVEILGEPHLPKEQLASSGEFHPVRLDALSQSRVEVLFHAAKVRKRFDICKYNILSDSVLNVVSGLSGRVGSPSRGEPNERFLSASAEPAEGCRRQIFGGREHDLAA